MFDFYIIYHTLNTAGYCNHKLLQLHNNIAKYIHSLLLKLRISVYSLIMGKMPYEVSAN